MTKAPVWLVEIDAYTGSGVETLRFASHGYTTKPDDTPANTSFKGVIQSMGRLEQHLFDEGRTMGAGAMTFGAISLINADGVLDNWLDYGFAGRAVRIYRLASVRDAFSTAVLKIRATAERLDSTDAYDVLRLVIRDRRFELAGALQTNTYAGTTNSTGNSAEGDTELKGQVKPLVFGKVLNVRPVLANAYDLIYQVNDGAVDAIIAYDGGAQLTLDADYANIAALNGASLSGGFYATCLAEGLFRIGGRPEFAITADVDEGATGADRYFGEVAQRILDQAGISSGDIDSDSFDDLPGWQCGILFDSEISAIDALNQLLGGINAYVLPSPLGVYTAGRLTAPAGSVDTIRKDRNLLDGQIGVNSNPDSEAGLPAWRITVRHRPVWHVQDSAALAVKGQSSRGDLVGSKWREAVAADSGVLTVHPLAREMTIETYAAFTGNAETLVSQLAALYGVRRDVIELSVAEESTDDFALGDTITVELDFLDYSAGRDMNIIGWIEDFDEGRTSLILWG